ncbi:phage baseplate assembly protein V [Psychrobacter sp. KCTC 72983]|jgi:phage baseplate assembly protein V|uniref:phage baseplate assembly protein V n=1 Tax=Psychrobacter sp. KCTC 72983 TaxID=2733866 RepID=UPI001648E62C|nr:phage baseplate assembly protein V [Psychrobacter sp. KCTC 72983]
MNAEDQRRLHNILTIGTVTEIDADQALMRLAVGDNETDWINIPAIAAGSISAWRCPSIGEQYLLGSPSGELANAIPIISIYSDQHPSPSTNPNEIRIRYNDTDFCSIDVVKSQLTMHISETLIKSKTSVVLDTPNTRMTGSLQVDKGIHAKEAIKSDDEVYAKDIKLSKHGHKNVENGSGTSGDPV